MPERFIEKEPRPGSRPYSDLEKRILHVHKYLQVSELRLIPKESSSGPEGTVFYDSVDKCIYVGVETG